MIFYIRDIKGLNYFEVECFLEKKEVKIKSYLYTSNWVKLTYSCNLISIIDSLQEFTDWFYATQYNNEIKNNQIKACNIIRQILKNIINDCKKIYSFYLIED